MKAKSERKKRKKFTGLLLVVLALSIVLASCGIGGGKEEEETQEETPTEPTITLTVKEIFNIASKSGSLWEFLSRIFPDKIVKKDSAGNFTYSEVNDELPKNEYDWEDLSNTLKGIDVSSYQKGISWKNVASTGEIDFAMIRVGYRGYSEGKLVVDTYFKSNAKGATDAGIPIGVYFWTTAINTTEAVEEADFVIKTIADYDVTWPVVLDLENSVGSNNRAYGLSKTELTDIIIAFCDRIKEAGYTPMIYANSGWFTDKMELERLTEYDKWLAQYFRAPQFPYEFSIWQQTDSGDIYGINGTVDIDYSIENYGYTPTGWN